MLCLWLYVFFLVFSCCCLVCFDILRSFYCLGLFFCVSFYPYGYCQVLGLLSCSLVLLLVRFVAFYLFVTKWPQRLVPSATGKKACLWSLRVCLGDGVVFVGAYPIPNPYSYPNCVGFLRLMFFFCAFWCCFLCIYTIHAREWVIVVRSCCFSPWLPACLPA